jgi:hypothetical protein
VKVDLLKTSNLGPIKPHSISLVIPPIDPHRGLVYYLKIPLVLAGLAMLRGAVQV